MRVLNHLELASQLQRAGIGTAADQQRAALATTDVEVVTSPWPGDGPASVPGNLLRGDGLFADVDVVHLNLFGPMSLALATATRRRGIPLVVHAHVTKEDFAESFRGSGTIAGPLGRYLRWFYSRADQVLVPSEYTKGVLESYPVTAPIRPISNGVDLDSLDGHEDFRETYRDRFDLDGMVPFVVGNVFERKGLTTFCELAQATEYEFAWFGTYDTGLHASETVKRWVSNPPENVTFTGWVDDKRGAFGAGDVFLFPSKVENQGIVVLEAMACGKPVVLRDIPVFREYYTHEHDCLLCADFDEFVDALERLESDLALRERLGENARETAAGHSLERTGEELASVYRSLLDNATS